MLSPSDTLLILIVALLLFGPEQLPKIARQLGDAMRNMQNTTHSFMLEMERAAAAHEIASPVAPEHEIMQPPHADEPNADDAARVNSENTDTA